MAEVIVCNLAEEFLGKLNSIACQQIGLRWGVKKELRKLMNMISTIRCVLLDAQERQTSNCAVKDWLERFRLIFYDANNLLDEVATEALRREVDTRKSLLREVRYFFTSSNPLIRLYVVGHKIKDINRRLDEFVQEMRDFEFVRAVERPIEIKRREETSSFVYIPEVIGRESDKDDLIKLLLSSSVEENVQIIPIVGMGGLGKTILAQSVYNDDKIRDNFSQKFWVCVSDDFDLKGILVKLLTKAGENVNNNEGFEHLQFRVREMLSHEKFFLVLDDVWNKDCEKWEKLKSLLMTGARGSRIAVTTRDKEVASIVCTMDPYELKGLPDDDCLAILVKWAFKKGEESKHDNLITIGREIAKKCGGVPLAARTLGAFLFSKTNERDWLRVRDNEMWADLQGKNDITPVLKLSYNEMPSHLKRCFAYCSLFEKDAVIDKEVLMYQWMAHGFLQSSYRDEELEDIGEDCINELVRRSFLQPKYYDGDAYTMHDLVHDLAQYVAGNECFKVKGATTEVIPDRVQHVVFDSSSYQGLPRGLIKAKKLQTIILPKERNFFSLNNEDPGLESSVEAVISSFRCLRVLDAGGKCVNVLPKEIEKLNHLRYLTVYGVEALRKSLCKLLNLQYLDVRESTLHKLPGDFGKLVNLRFLSLSTQLTCLPEKGIRGFTSLRVLLLVHNPELRSLGEGIQYLTRLRKLELSSCPKLASLPVGFEHLTSLEHLDIFSCFNLEFSEEDDLRGLRSLKRLVLCNLPKLVTLPKGLQDAAATLTHLDLRWCEGLTTLSESLLPNLQSLQLLEIEDCPNLVSLPEGMQRLTKLCHLNINYCDQLSGRCEEGVGEDWSKIAHVPEIYINRKKINLLEG